MYYIHKGSNMKKYIPIIAIILIFIVGVGILAYPLVSSVVNNIESRKIAEEQIISAKNMDEGKRDELFKQADDYNKNLLSTVILSDPFDAETYNKISAKYKETFDVDGNGLIGYVEVPKINVFLPVYHGTSEEVLSRGAGHLNNTSLPVGGKSTHSVISAHSAFPTETFFDYLTDLKEGDRFYIHVLNEVLTYEVDQIKIVLPNETRDLYVVEGQDYVTLLTCTPYSINTHRLLVRGKRVIEEKPDEVVIHNISTDSGNIYLMGYKINYFYAAIGIAGFIAAVAMVVFLITRLNKRKKTAHLKKDGDGDG